MLKHLLVFLMISNTNAATIKNDIPKQAYQYKDTISYELTQHFPTIPNKAYAPSLIEHESCINLKHKKCWNPQSRLLTAREEGAGLSQITRTFRKDGSLRFDKLTEMKDTYREELKELTWKNVYLRADLQIRTLVLLTRENYQKFFNITDTFERLAFTDAAYNGGYRGVLNDRRACSLNKSCDSTKWFNNVEKTCTKSKKTLYGDRSACDINRHHVTDVLKYKLPKYERYYFNCMAVTGKC